MNDGDTNSGKKDSFMTKTENYTVLIPIIHHNHALSVGEKVALTAAQAQFLVLRGAVKKDIESVSSKVKSTKKDTSHE